MSILSPEQSEKLFVWVATIAIVITLVALGEVVFASSLVYGSIAFLVAIVGLLVFSWALNAARTKKIGAPSNTQLQQSPPAILARGRHDT